MPPEEWGKHMGLDSSISGRLRPTEEEPVPLILDSVAFIPDEGIFYEVFRGVCALSSLDSLEVARITIGL